MDAQVPDTIFSACDYPALVSLGLREEELNALVRQGFLSAEKRRDATYYKLRFRVDGHQQVRYVKSELVPTIRNELTRLQTFSRCRRELRELQRASVERFKQMKAQLDAVLEGKGFRRHGYAFRKTRAKNRFQL
jgi:hypothetical protein